MARLSLPATLPEIVAVLDASAALPVVEPPAESATLKAYIEAYGEGRTLAQVMLSLGYSPNLAIRVDQRAQVMPASVISRISEALGRPRDEILWACGNQELTAQAPGLGRRVP